MSSFLGKAGSKRAVTFTRYRASGKYYCTGILRGRKRGRCVSPVKRSRIGSPRWGLSDLDVETQGDVRSSLCPGLAWNGPLALSNRNLWTIHSAKALAQDHPGSRNPWTIHRAKALAQDHPGNRNPWTIRRAKAPAQDQPGNRNPWTFHGAKALAQDQPGNRNLLTSQRANGPSQASPGQSESASAALGPNHLARQAPKGRTRNTALASGGRITPRPARPAC
jgi:hypothetical protein